MSKTVTLTVPFFQQQGLSSHESLARILSKAKTQASRAWFTPTETISAGALLATERGYPKGIIYGLASPIECYADQKTVYIVNKADLSPEDETTMVATLNHFLQQDGIELKIIESGLWLFEMQHHTAVTMRDLGDVIGKSMDAQLPTGNDEVYWRRLLTECQMLLSQSVSVWFWGNGIDNISLKTPFDSIYTDDPILKAKAHNAGVVAKPLPAAWNNAMLGDHLLITPKDPAELEDKWLVPLLASLKSGVIQTLIVKIDEQTDYVLARRHLYYFWNKIKPISVFLPDGNKPIQ